MQCMGFSAPILHKTLIDQMREHISMMSRNLMPSPKFWSCEAVGRTSIPVVCGRDSIRSHSDLKRGAFRRKPYV